MGQSEIRKFEVGERGRVQNLKSRKVQGTGRTREEIIYLASSHAPGQCRRPGKDSRSDSGNSELHARNSRLSERVWESCGELGKARESSREFWRAPGSLGEPQAGPGSPFIFAVFELIDLIDYIDLVDLG